MWFVVPISHVILQPLLYAGELIVCYLERRRCAFRGCCLWRREISIQCIRVVEHDQTSHSKQCDACECKRSFDAKSKWWLALGRFGRDSTAWPAFLLRLIRMLHFGCCPGVLCTLAQNIIGVLSMVQSEVDFCVAKFRLSPKQNSAVEEDFLGRTNRVPYRQIPRTARVLI